MNEMNLTYKHTCIPFLLIYPLLCFPPSTVYKGGHTEKTPQVR